MHPDMFKADINRWHELRSEAVNVPVHIDRVNSILLYNSQLTSVTTKFPADIGLEMSYASVFNPEGVPVTLANLLFERASVVFNLAALFSQLANAEDRSHVDGIKRATSFYQQAAGVLSFLRTSVLPKFTANLEAENAPSDLTKDFVQALEWIMLAQAQECFWQKAKLDQFKNALLSRLAANAASLYEQASTTIKDSSPSIRQEFPSHWLAHIQAKHHHFGAVAQYRKSADEGEANKYGVELARLGIAEAEAKKAYDMARRGRVSTAVVQDAQSLLEAVTKALHSAQRDNDLIYHQDVPTPSQLPIITHAAVAQVSIPPALINPNSLVKPSEAIFFELLGWGAQEAINIYNERRKDIVEHKIVGAAKQLRAHSDRTLRSLNLPASLEALERPIGLPPSLLRKAEEVRLEDGPHKIEQSIEDIQRLAENALQILNEAMDILDEEASEDEAARKDSRLNRPPSHEANREFTEHERKYRIILEQAGESDELVRQKWDEWEDNIIELTWSEEDLEASIPSSLPSSTSQRATVEGSETQKHARVLRGLLESLDGLHRDVEQLVKRAESLARADDIHDRIVKVANGFERSAGVVPSMFEATLDDQLAKYDRFIHGVEEFQPRERETMDSIRKQNELFLQSRRDDPSVKEREHALQSLDLSYHKYREIVNNLDEGIKFYNGLAEIFAQFKESCRVWRRDRSREIRILAEGLQSLSLDDTSDQRATTHPSGTSIRSQPLTSTPRGAPSTATSTPAKLPALDSSEWGFEEMVLPPPPQRRKR